MNEAGIDMATPSVFSTRVLTRAKGRDKPQLSCDFCRKRKLRCDRKQPCQSCVRLGQASACSFPHSQLPRLLGNGSESSADQTTFQQRINHLETLVRMLAEKQNKTSTSTSDSTEHSEISTTVDHKPALTRDFGHIRLQGAGSSYVESDHWMAILEEINDLKNMASEDAEHRYDLAEEETQTLPGADLFFLHTYPATKMDIIAAIPPRPVLDSIIAKYFKTADMPITLLIHRRVFFKQYEKFWQDPLSTPTMWMTILFGMMFIVAYYALFINMGDNPVDEGTLVEYQKIVSTAREKMIQCLKLSNYMKGTPHTIEALLMFLQTEYVQGEDAQQGCWQLIGTIIRVALKMGYHRDGSHFPEMTAFEAEMRRRTWYMLIQFDIASASQVGLPRAIKEAQCDTAEPRSLLDDDFDDTTTILPPARPYNEHTLSQFLIYKSRVVSVYGMICDFTTSSKQRDYQEAMRLDDLLRKAFTQKPPVLELKPLHQSIMDETNLITRRLYIAMTYYHAQMTLHRKFMIFAKSNIKYSVSHTTCIDAALTASQLQAELVEHTQPGRMLYADRWKIFTLIQSEFLLATIILCYNLDDDITNDRYGRSSLSTQEGARKTVVALQSAQNIWRRQQDMSKEARTAVKAIDVVLGKARNSAIIAGTNVVSSWVSSSDNSPDPVSGAMRREIIASFPGVPTSVDPLLPSLPSTGSTQSASQTYPSPDTLPNPQSDFSHESWDKFFDLDRSWDAWLQY